MAWALPDRPEQVEAILELRPALVSVSFGGHHPVRRPAAVGGDRGRGRGRHRRGCRAGGISGPRGLAAVLAAGAAGAWAGTAFLTCTEAMTTPPARQRLLDADETSTVHGIVFDRASRAGWPDEFGGRALRNAFFDRWYGREDELRADDAAHQEYVAGLRAADADSLR
jgi:nitronate monooxygenase